MSFAMGQVHRAEALAALLLVESDSFDMLLTDAPYSSGGLMRSDRNNDVHAKYEQSGVALQRVSFSGDNRDQRSWTYWCQLWLSEALRILKDGAYALIFTDWRQLPASTDAMQAGGFVWRGVIAWDKGESARAPHTGYFRHQCEYVVWGTKGALPSASHGGPWPGMLRYPVRQDDKFHLTGKPTELLRQLVKVVPKGSRILDPFAGSGTTLVACELEGRTGLGFEIEPANVEIANERIRAAREGIDAKAALEEQRALFAAAAEAVPGVP